MSQIITNSQSFKLSDGNTLVVREYFNDIEDSTSFRAWHSGKGEMETDSFGNRIPGLEDISTDMIAWFEENIKEQKIC